MDMFFKKGSTYKLWLFFTHIDTLLLPFWRIFRSKFRIQVLISRHVVDEDIISVHKNCVGVDKQRESNF